MNRYYIAYHVDRYSSWIQFQVGSKDSSCFAMLFTLRESLRTSDSVPPRRD